MPRPSSVLEMLGVSRGKRGVYEVAVFLVVAFIAVAFAVAVLVTAEPTLPQDEVTTDGFVFASRTYAPTEYAFRDGRLAELDLAERTALCWTHNEYRANGVADAKLEMLDGPQLLNSARLLSTEFAGSFPASEAEKAGSWAQNWSVGLILAVLEEDGGFSVEELSDAERYLTAGQGVSAPSELEGYVVFRVTKTASSSLIVRMRVGDQVNENETFTRSSPLQPAVKRPNDHEGLLLSQDDGARVCDTLPKEA